MRTVVVSHYFPPESGVPQARLSDRARYWPEAGDHFTVLTGMPNHPTGVVPPEYKGYLRAREQVDGYRVVRTWGYATPNERIVRKTIGHPSLMVSSVVVGTCGRSGGHRGGVVSRLLLDPVAMADSPDSAGSVCRRDQRPVAGNLRGSWDFAEPLAHPAAHGARDGRLPAADMVVVGTDGFRDDVLRRGVDPDKVHVVRNEVDVEASVPKKERDDVLGHSRSSSLVDFSCVVLDGQDERPNKKDEQGPPRAVEAYLRCLQNPSRRSVSPMASSRTALETAAVLSKISGTT